MVRRWNVHGFGACCGAGGRPVYQQERLSPFCRQNPHVALKVLAVVGRRLRHLVGLVESMTFGSVTQRLAKMLLDASQAAGANSFDLPATHQEFASRLGTVREVVSRNLGRFRAQALIQIHDRQVEIVHCTGLEQEASRKPETA